jgi:hypothetical protein
VRMPSAMATVSTGSCQIASRKRSGSWWLTMPAGPSRATAIRVAVGREPLTASLERLRREADGTTHCTRGNPGDAPSTGVISNVVANSSSSGTN